MTHKPREFTVVRRKHGGVRNKTRHLSTKCSETVGINNDRYSPTSCRSNDLTDLFLRRISDTETITDDKCIKSCEVSNDFASPCL